MHATVNNLSQVCLRENVLDMFVKLIHLAQEQVFICIPSCTHRREKAKMLQEVAFQQSKKGFNYS